MSRGRGRPFIPSPERQQLVAALKARYDAGASIRQLATEEGCSYGCIHSRLEQAGTQFRSRGGAQRHRPKGDQT